jgi:hypothetical protein
VPVCEIGEHCVGCRELEFFLSFLLQRNKRGMSIVVAVVSARSTVNVTIPRTSPLSS